MHRVAFALAAAAPLVAAHGPGGDKPPVAAPPAVKTPAGVLATDPAGAKCKAIPGDATWPKDDVWQKAFPGLKSRGTSQTKPAQPDYRLEVSTVKQVQDAVNFARENNIRLAMITSGHDGLGRNNAQTGLLLGLENLRGLRVETSFTPTAQGVASVLSDTPMAASSSGMAGMAGMAGMNMKRAAPVAVTFGAGMSTQSVNDKIATQNIFTNGAEHGEVSVAGGWAQCGGHGPMSSAYGLGVDDVLEYQVVTPDGQLKIANSVANPDLFWALRGGCGSTYGVVVQTTVKAFPSNKVTVASWTINTKDANSIFEPTAWLHTKFVELSKKGVQGYYLVFPTMLKGIFHSVGSLANQEFSNQTWTPILEKLKSFPNIDPASGKVDYINYNSYKAYYDGTWGPAEDDDSKRKVKRNNWWWGGEHGLERRSASVELPMLAKKEKGGSRLLDEAALSHPDLTAALKAGMPTGPGAMLRGGMIGGGYVLKVKAEDTSVHPSWRKAYATLWVGGDHAPLAKLATGMGAYINEGSYNESNWKEVFWGSNYQRLSDIKTKLDPNFVFYATPGINADQMVVDAQGRLCQIDAASVNKANVYPPVGDNWMNNPDQ